MTTETLISFARLISSLGFLSAFFVTFLAVRRFGKSALGSIFSYILIGTGIFFAITVFQQLGNDFFRISPESMSLWWHLMFFMALASFYYGLKLLVGLGAAETESNKGLKIGVEKIWAIVALAILVGVFFSANFFEYGVLSYTNSSLGQMGFHHFVAVLLSGMVGSYLLLAKKDLGQIGKAVASPMIAAIWILSLQHFWELLVESWHIVPISGHNSEGVEQIFFIAVAVSLLYAAFRLKSFAKA